MTLSLLLLAAGLVVLVVGGDLLVRGASNLAASWGMSPLVVGLTVVSFGTSAPELAVGVGAAWTPEASLVIGNVLGSNIFNTLAVLGVVALIGPLAVEQRLVKLEVPALIAICALVWVMGRHGALSQLSAGALIVLLAAYTGFLIRGGKRERETAVRDEYDAAYGAEASERPGVAWRQWAFVLGGLGLLVGGAQIAVGGAVDISRALGVDELIIGLTVVAAGTSLPELVASVVAALKGQRDIAVGNVIGSNLFNLLAVLGIAGATAPNPLPIPDGALTFDLPVVLACAVITLPIVWTDLTVSRKEGALLVLGYCAYLATTVIRATGI